MNSITRDIIRLILDMVDTRGRLAMVRVCRRWYCDLKGCGLRLRHQVPLLSVRSDYWWIQEYVIMEPIWWTWDWWRYVWFDKLEIVTINRGIPLETVERCRKLKTLICHDRANLDGIGSISAETIRLLDLRKSYYMADISPVGKFTSLQRLKLANCYDLSDLSALSTCRELTHLDISGCVKISGIMVLANCPKMTVLKARFCARITSIDALAVCPEMRKLDAVDTSISSIEPLAYCQKLRYLDLTGTDITSVRVLGRCPMLERLYLDFCLPLDDTAVLIHCIRLRWFSMRKVRDHSLADRGLSAHESTMLFRSYWA